MLSFGPHPGGYATVSLYGNGSRRPTLVHIIIAETFHGPRPFPEAEVRHIDGNKSNCSASNLCWGTRVENEHDKLAHGTRLRGEQMPTTKLTREAVLAIRRRRGEPQQDLADEFGCTFSNVSAIQLGKSWRHV